MLLEPVKANQGKNIFLLTGFYCIFSLLIAGGKIPFPLRSWRESTLPTSILDIVDKLQYEVSRSFWYKVVSILVVRYELKKWNCTKISITSSKVCSWTRNTFWLNILRSLSQVRETIYISKELTKTCIETTGNPFA